MTLELRGAAPRGWSEVGRTTLEIHTGAWRSRRPLHVEAEAPCRLACPAGESVARWIDLAARGDWAAAWALIREDNPLPAVTGRVCAHPCERACNRSIHDGAVAVNALERFVGDWGLAHGVVAVPRVRRRERVAVVGSGPAGLACAAHLGAAGYRVTIFEADRRLGGLLRHGIPEYRLPRAVVEREINLILALGIEVVTGARLGTTVAWDELAGYDAVFLGCGAGTAIALEVPGVATPGVADGLGFLGAVNAGAPPAIGTRVAVIGGGSTAMDVARTARRLGASMVTVLALEERAAMPADAEEVGQALAEGVTIVNGVGVHRFVESADRLIGVVVGPATFERRADGAVVPRFAMRAARLVAADTALLALGQRIEVGSIAAGARLEHGVVAVDVDGRADASGLFAGGDVASRRRTVADAIGMGTRAARGIARMLGDGRARPTGARPWAVERPDLVVGEADVNLARFPRARRAHRWERLPEERIRSFVEVQAPLGERAAREESARCFSCGRCTSCDVCVAVCPDLAIVHDGGYRVATAYCKGCGLCAAECPRGALRMVTGR